VGAAWGTQEECGEFSGRSTVIFDAAGYNKNRQCPMRGTLWHATAHCGMVHFLHAGGVSVGLDTSMLLMEGSMSDPAQLYDAILTGNAKLAEEVTKDAMAPTSILPNCSPST